MCHMLADTDEELHAMADKIGVARRWWQSPAKSSGSHYDIALSKRALAVAAGAVEISLKQCAAMNFRRRVLGSLGEPEAALELLRNKEASIGDWFHEEDSGLVMYDKLWYVLSDSGAAYFSYGFLSADEAQKALVASVDYDAVPTVPKFLGAAEGWDDMGEANVLLGANLRSFNESIQ
mgnify:FL=1